MKLLTALKLFLPCSSASAAHTFKSNFRQNGLNLLQLFRGIFLRIGRKLTLSGTFGQLFNTFIKNRCP